MTGNKQGDLALGQIALLSFSVERGREKQQEEEENKTLTLPEELKGRWRLLWLSQTAQPLPLLNRSSSAGSDPAGASHRISFKDFRQLVSVYPAFV